MRPHPPRVDLTRPARTIPVRAGLRFGPSTQRDKLFKPAEWINDGDAVVVKPMGTIAAGPLNRQKGILYAEVDTEAARRARRSLDVCGHYSRPDVFAFSVNRKPSQPASFVD